MPIMKSATCDGGLVHHRAAVPKCGVEIQSIQVFFAENTWITVTNPKLLGDDVYVKCWKNFGTGKEPQENGQALGILKGRPPLKALSWGTKTSCRCAVASGIWGEVVWGQRLRNCAKLNCWHPSCMVMFPLISSKIMAGPRNKPHNLRTALPIQQIIVNHELHWAQCPCGNILADCVQPTLFPCLWREEITLLAMWSKQLLKTILREECAAIDRF